MFLALGDRRYEVGRRAVVLGALASSNVFEEPSRDVVLDQAERALAEGADALTLPAHDDVGSLVSALRVRYDVPLGIAAARVDRLEAAFDAGASVAIVRGHRPELFEVIARAGASVIVVAPRAMAGPDDSVMAVGGATTRARAAGIPAERIIVDVGVHGRHISESTRLRLDAVAALRSLGHVVAVDALFLDCRATAALVAPAIVRGCRLVAATDVRAARRTVDVVAALVGAKEDSAV